MERIYHRWEHWECYPAGFYKEKPPKGMTNEECETVYRDFLRDTEKFGAVLDRVIGEWKHSCEHYLTNENMNRVAWLGQAALAYAYGIPSRFRGGYNLLTDEEKQAADRKALEYLNVWMRKHGYEEVTEESCKSKTIPNLY